MSLPTIAECAALFEKYRVPDNIIAHCRKVCDVGTFLAAQLKQKGVPVNGELVSRACLLHDLMKAAVFDELRDEPHVKCFPTTAQKEMHAELRRKYTGMHETEITFLLLKDAYPELAAVIRGMYDAQGRHDVARMPIEEKIVWYSDWRCFVDDIVTVDERAAEAYERKKKKLSKIIPAWIAEINQVKSIEQQLFSHLDFAPEKLKELLT